MKQSAPRTADGRADGLWAGEAQTGACGLILTFSGRLPTVLSCSQVMPPFLSTGHCPCHPGLFLVFLSRQLGKVQMVYYVPLHKGWVPSGRVPTKPPAPYPNPPSPESLPSQAPVPAGRPRLTMMQLGLLMDHRLTRQSSPPVASSRPEPLPSTSEDTLLAWATISSTQERARGEGSQGP